MNSGFCRRRFVSFVARGHRPFVPRRSPSLRFTSVASFVDPGPLCGSSSSAGPPLYSKAKRFRFLVDPRSSMSGKAGRTGDGGRKGDGSPEKKGDSPSSAKMDSNSKSKASAADKSNDSDAKSPRPAPSEAIKKETTDIKQESKDVATSIVTAGDAVRVVPEGCEDNLAKDVDQDAKVKPNVDKNPVAANPDGTVSSKLENPVGLKSEVKVEEVVKTEEQDKNKITKESEKSSPDFRMKSNFFSTNDNSKKKNSPELSKTQRNESRYVTRQLAVMQERDKFLAMTVDEKRKFYSHKDYVMLDEIETWPKFYSRNVRSLKKLYPSAKEVDKALNDHQGVIEVDGQLNSKVSLFEGDITMLEIDGIVNAANRFLLGGGGVDGAIHRAAGSQLVEECKTLNGCEVGDAKTTCGYKLPAKYVIHTVGPQTTTRSDLRNCYINCFREMEKHNMRSIAFCCISTGIYGYPNELAVLDALSCTRKFLKELKNNGKIDSIDRIIFCLFLPIDIRLYQSWIQVYFPTETRESSKFINKNKIGAAEISSDSDSPASGKENKVDHSASEKLDSSTMDVGEKITSEEDMDEEVGTDHDDFQKVRSKETTGSPGDVLPDKKSKMDPGVRCSSKLDM